MELYDKVQEAAAFIKAKTNANPAIGIILGSGLGNLSKEIKISHEIAYHDIPHFPEATVKGHGGRLIFGEWAGKSIVAMAGRFHYYEGHSIESVTFPVRVMKYIGVETLFVSNAAGGMQAGMEVGDLMIITDHINLQPEHPLRGKNDERFGPRFPEMLHTYDKDLIEKACAVADELKIRYSKGVYVAVQGPTFETPAEYKMFALCGGDAVGMSTAPEVIVAKHMNMRVFAISVISDIGYPAEAMDLNITHEIVLQKAAAAEPMMTKIIESLVAIA